MVCIRGHTVGKGGVMGNLEVYQGASHSMAGAKCMAGDKYYHSIKIHRYLRGPESIEIPPFRPQFI